MKHHSSALYWIDPDFAANFRNIVGVPLYKNKIGGFFQHSIVMICLALWDKSEESWPSFES